MTGEDTPFVSLQDFLDLKFVNVEHALANFQISLANFRSALEKLALEMVTIQQFERALSEINLLRNKVDDLEARTMRHDADMRIIKWLGSAVVAMTLYLIGAYLKGLLGV